MSIKQATPSQGVEAILAEKPPVVFISLTITATISVPEDYLTDIETNTEIIRMYVDNLALEFEGDAVSVDIK